MAGSQPDLPPRRRAQVCRDPLVPPKLQDQVEGIEAKDRIRESHFHLRFVVMI